MNHSIDKRGELVAVCGNSGSGKSTLVRYALNEMPEDISYMKTFTTRKRRPSEDEVEYEFVTKEEYSRIKKLAPIWDESIIYNNYYGTDASCQINSLEAGRNLIVCSPPSANVIEGMRQIYGKIITVHLQTDLERSHERQETRDGATDLGRIATDSALDESGVFISDYSIETEGQINIDQYNFLNIIKEIIR